MTDAIAFYHNPQSPGRIVHWMLEEMNAAYLADAFPSADLAPSGY